MLPGKISIFGKSYNPEDFTREIPLEEKLRKRYKSAVSNILLIVIFSSINLLLLVTNSDRYFLFSAYIPYLLGDYAMFYGGKYPAEYYKDIPDISFFGTSVFAVIIAVAVICILFYLLCYIFARKGKAVWLIAALSFFVVDSAVMIIVFGFSFDTATDTIFHILMIVSLILGMSANIKLRDMPANADASVTEEEKAYDSVYADLSASPVLRIVSPEEKARVFVEADYSTMHIVFRRTKRVNELVINNMVYDEFEVLVEKAHTLGANVGGHRIEASFDGKITVVITVDGKEIARKKRFY